jgi:hypothetical protein
MSQVCRFLIPYRLEKLQQVDKPFFSTKDAGFDPSGNTDIVPPPAIMIGEA